MKNTYFFLVIALVIGAIFLIWSGSQDAAQQVASGQNIPSSIQGDIQTTTDGTKYLIHPSEIRSGGPPKDGIPSIDDPQFVGVAEADKWISDNELVMVATINDITKVYPLQILVWHEIVNDFFGSDPILITYCPLCGSGIAYHRVLNGQTVEFGTSGKLYNSNLIMYDRLTDTYWTQIDGLAVVGPLTGQELEEVSIDTVSWRDFKSVEENLGAQVLSRDTGHSRRYGTDPYGNYYEDTFLIFNVDNEDDRVHPKTVIFGIEVNGAYTAYMEESLLENPTIRDTVNGVDIEVTRTADGRVKIINLDTGEEIVKERDFWFAWYAFHPETSLYGVEPQN